MRNYYGTLGLERDCTETEIETRLQALRATEPDLAEKAESILLDESRKEIYDQVHLQYEAIGLAYQVFKSEIQDTNNWDRRLVEFISSQE